MRGMLESLNAEQRRAVTTTEGPVLVLAGAGTGKTRVITVRIAYLLGKRVAARRVFAVTFTNKAAREMRDRAARLVGGKRAAEVTAGTFHAFCARTLREFGARIGVPKDFAIADEHDQLATAKQVLRDLGVPEGRLHPRALLSQVSLRKNRLERPEEDLLGLAYARYDDALRRAHTLDFDDLLVRTLDLMRADAETLATLRDRHRYLMVDEYQDTNAPQYEIVRALAGERRNLCVVGDDDQSIYGWRGADVKRILGFQRDFPGAAVIRLETNYRSTQPILDAANAVIAHNTSRHEKSLRSAAGPGGSVRIIETEDEEREARGVVGDILKRVRQGEARFGDVAILVRTQMQPRPFEAVLRERQVPYVLVGGLSFFDRKEVRDLLAYLKLVAQPGDEISLLRVINRPPRAIGRSSLDKMLAFASREGVPVATALDRAAEIEGLPGPAAEAAVTLRATLHEVAKRRDLVGLVRALIEAVDYRAEVDRCYPEAEVREQRWAGVMEVANLAENYARRHRRGTLSGFLETLALTANDDPTPADEARRDAVTLMTLHAAKGLEFPWIYLVGLEEGILPHERAVAEEGIEEERRLMYVGITRARRHLTITHCKERAKRGKRGASMRSRFLFEMEGVSPPKGWTAAGAPPAKGRKRRLSGRGA